MTSSPLSEAAAAGAAAGDLRSQSKSHPQLLLRLIQIQHREQVTSGLLLGLNRRLLRLLGFLLLSLTSCFFCPIMFFLHLLLFLCSLLLHRLQLLLSLREICLSLLEGLSGEGGGRRCVVVCLTHARR